MILDLATLRTAYAATRQVTRRTPLMESSALAAQFGASRLFVKPESLQLAGSFKIRGASWRLMQLTDEERKRGVVAYSSGNFAQGLACAGQMQGVPVTIVMPNDAPAAKVDATRGFGATVELTDHGNRAREEVASELARAISAEQGLTLLHPFDDPHVVAGQAGVALEALDQLAEIDAEIDLLLCPVGGGGLVGGVARAFHYLSPDTQLIGAEPAGFDGMGTSLRAGRIETVPLGGSTICDGLMARRPGVAPFAAVEGTGLTGVTVEVPDVKRAMKLAFERLKLVFEPSGASPLAALLSGKVEARDRSALLIASGGNVSLADFMKHTADA